MHQHMMNGALCGGNQRAHFRDAKADQKSFYKAINERGGCIQIREGPDYVMGRGVLRGAIASGKRSRGGVCAVVGQGTTSGPSLNSSPHYSIHEAKALRAPLGMKEHVPPFS